MNAHEFQQSFCQYVYNYPSIHSMGGQQSLIFAAGLDIGLQQQIQFNTNSQVFVVGLFSLLKQWGTLSDGRDPIAEVIKVVMKSVGREKREMGQQLLRELGEVNFDVIKETHEQILNENSLFVTFQFEAPSDIVKDLVAFLQQNGVHSYVEFESRKEVLV